VARRAGLALARQTASPIPGASRLRLATGLTSLATGLTSLATGLMSLATGPDPDVGDCEGCCRRPSGSSVVCSSWP
jgi:hypothetical protein